VPSAPRGRRAGGGGAVQHLPVRGSREGTDQRPALGRRRCWAPVPTGTGTRVLAPVPWHLCLCPPCHGHATSPAADSELRDHGERKGVSGTPVMVVEAYRSNMNPGICADTMSGRVPNDKTGEVCLQGTARAPALTAETSGLTLAFGDEHADPSTEHSRVREETWTMCLVKTQCCTTSM
jgi:hypothetical protein